MKNAVKESDYFLRANEVQALLKPGELEEQVLAPADKAVVRAVDACRGHRVTVNGLMKKTGLSFMAVTLASYRLVALGLLIEKDPPKDWTLPKRLAREKGFPKPERAAVLAEMRETKARVKAAEAKGTRTRSKE